MKEVKKMDTICGHVEKIVYYSEESCYAVARFQEEGRKNLTTIIGYIPNISPGEFARITGKWVNNKKYGHQFQVENYETAVPITAEGIERYLGSGLIKGIGPVMAKRIVKAFGEKTLDIIENSPEQLTKVNGISAKRIETIKRAWEDQKEIKEIMLFLQSCRVGVSHAAKIYKTYGRDSIRVVKQNPYQLAADIRGIGFLSADRIAQNLGISPDSPLRVKEGVMYVLDSIVEEGHVYCPRDLLIKKAVELLKVPAECIEESIDKLAEEKRIIIDSNDNDGIYPAYLYTTETNLVKKLRELKRYRSALWRINVEKAIVWAETRLKIKLAEKQKQAVKAAFQDKVLVITGGPGTGKTTITRVILEIAKKITPRIILASPTGRAAKRLQESTGHEAKTIHRLLEYSPKKGEFRRNQYNPLEADIVIIDEASMVDIRLMYSLIRAIPFHAVLILIGDADQLPPVGPGNVLRDIIQSGSFRVITLNEIFRQSQQSRIITSAHRINRGCLPDIKNSPGSDFYFFKENDPDKIASLIVELCKNRIPKKFGYHPVNDIQVLSPMRKGIAGVDNLNKLLQEELNGEGRFIKIGNKMLRIGDKVMQIKNNYDKDVFNGDIGKITAINEIDQEIKVEFDDKIVSYDYADLDEIVLSYAISVHKSQGSEYPVVVMPVTTQHYILLQRNLIYTGITRAKKLVVLVGTVKALAIAVKNDRVQKRFTKLKERLAFQAERFPA